MSQWTHVCGVIRIDLLYEQDQDIFQNITRAFGNTCNYDSPEEAWNKCTVPKGSECSIQYKIAKTGSEHSSAWGLVYLWGDLRDYENYTEIYEWIKKACKDFAVRSCCVKIDVEFKDSYLVMDNWRKECGIPKLDLIKL